MLVNRPLALQVYSVRDAAAADFAGTMQQIKDMGYQGVELAGLYGFPEEIIRETLDNIGLKAISAHVPINLLLEDLDGTLQQYKAIGCSYIAIPHLDDTMRPGAPGFSQVLEAVPQIGQACRDLNMTLLYHNHDFEFIRMDDGQYGIDYLYSRISADLLQTELDTCWINVAGESPVEYIKKYAGRCPIVHLKDFYRDEQAEDGAQFYELIGEKKQKKQSRTGFEFRPVGHGLQDIPAIVRAAQESEAKWLVVEQDLSVGRTPLEAVKMSIDYLRSL